MENLQNGEGPGSSGGDAAEISDSAFQLNIMTMDTRISSFHVDKNILVSAFKEKIASQFSVPVGQQRLIFRGRFLEDERLVSEYNIEHGHTLHLVERKQQSPPGELQFLSASQMIPPREQVISRNDDPQVDPQSAAVERARILSFDETLFNLVTATVLPSTSADVSLVDAICSTSELAMRFMQGVLSDLSRRLREERRD